MHLQCIYNIGIYALTQPCWSVYKASCLSEAEVQLVLSITCYVAMADREDLNDEEPSPDKPTVPATGSESPLLNEKSPWVRQGWPASPKVVSSSIASVTIEIVVDVILFSFSVAFFAFGITVRYYDQTPTQQHPLMTRALLEAIKYVCLSFRKCHEPYSHVNRDQASFQSCSPASSVVRRRLYFCGVWNEESGSAF